MHHYPFHPGDYMLDTAHLEPMHDLCYRRALDLYYTSEQPLPDDKQLLSKRLRIGEQVLAEVLAEFFQLTPEGWTQGKCQRVIAKYQATSEARKAAGSLGGSVKAKQKPSKSKQLLSKSQSNASNQEPETKNQKPNLLLSAPDGAGPNGDGAAEASADELEPGSGQKKKKGGAALEGIQPLAWSPDTGWLGFTQDLWDELALAYPACDIRRQMLAMEQWLKANPAKARKSNWRKFVTNWLAKEQDRGGDLRGMPQPAWSGLGAKNEGGGSKPLLTIEDAPAGHEQAMEALFGEQWRDMCPAWPQMTASDKSQVRAWLRQHGKEAA